ncbi:GLPGLI family protein [Myroides marinus]|uniref:GLPGLI family protein n=1 Tax=Myroides marinus TaxID=703342 RepID=UPI00257838A7|nr:GLPGLI family protein [Myroides marinus]MDM1500869.1 GLPGLI family protein [Myroides marinus]
MKKYLLMLLITATSLAQSKDVELMRYEYQVEISNDKGKMIKSGIAILDIYNTESRFMDLKKYEYTQAAPIEKPQPGTSPSINWIVLTKQNNIAFYETIGLDNSYSEEDKNTIKWTILPEIKQWNDYKVQEATTTYGGREWTVWFTQEIPLQSGPYKFVNLPGFVVKAWDSENHFVFEFLTSKMTTTNWGILTDKKYVKYTREQTLKARKTTANKTYNQLFEERGISAGKEHTNRYNITIGKLQNPIERDF